MPRAILSLVILGVAFLAVARNASVAQDELVIVSIAERDGSGVIGDASLIDNGDGTTTIDIFVSGGRGGHPATLHMGTCDALGDPILDLETVDDVGTSLTDIAQPFDDLLNQGRRAIVIRLSDSANAPVIACGTFGEGDAPAVGVTPPAASPAPDDPDLPACTDFDAWIWAQTVYLENAEGYGPPLDQDDDGIACEELPVGGFAPALWTDSIPESAVPAQVTGIFDAGNLQVVIDGQLDTVRMHHLEAPGPEDCGDASASSYLAFVLTLAPGRIVYLEYEGPERDEEGRRLAYVWYEIAGDPYLVNEVMVRGGWAASEPTSEESRYTEQFRAAERFSIEHVLGVRLECGRFNQPPGSRPSEEQLERARERQPSQGQF